MKFTHKSTQSLFSVVFVSKVTSLGLTGSKKATIVILFHCYELGSLVEMSVNAQMNKDNFYNLHNVRTQEKKYTLYIISTGCPTGGLFGTYSERLVVPNEILCAIFEGLRFARLFWGRFLVAHFYDVVKFIV